MVVVGRTEDAFSAMPERLRQTEELVNHVYKLATGRSWDLMFAIRVLSKEAAGVVANCDEPTLANDVVWPLLAEQQGLDVGYVPAAGLAYRVQADFDSAKDGRDNDASLWIERLEIAGRHASAMRPYLGAFSPLHH
ncbi:MAG TPA: hypothetical protein VFN61_14935 [Acidimicrobiales bacterium]|nr:hypothetical protein [Acidimicrobiales bacterium]